MATLEEVGIKGETNPFKRNEIARRIISRERLLRAAEETANNIDNIHAYNKAKEVINAKT